MARTLEELDQDFDAHVLDSDKKYAGIDELRKDFQQFRDDVKPVIEFFRAMTLNGRGVVKMVGFAGAIIIILVGLKTLGIHLW
jgi:hypothetical protein